MGDKRESKQIVSFLCLGSKVYSRIPNALVSNNPDCFSLSSGLFMQVVVHALGNIENFSYISPTKCFFMSISLSFIKHWHAMLVSLAKDTV